MNQRSPTLGEIGNLILETFRLGPAVDWEKTTKWQLRRSLFDTALLSQNRMAVGTRNLLFGDGWRYTISILGALMLAVGVGTVLLDGQLTGEEILQISSLVVTCLLVIGLGLRIAVEVRDLTHLFRILGWMSMGVLIIGALATWYHFVSQTADTAFENALLFLSALAAGTLFGALVGYYDVQVRELIARASREEARKEYLHEQQETLSSLNGILRHQILNDLSAISGRAELLSADKIEREEALDSIFDHCDHMESTVHRIETVVDVLTHVSDSSDISTVETVERATEIARESYPELTVNTDNLMDVTVQADELLDMALAEIFENVAVHSNGSLSVTVEETSETSILRISDDGPGIDVSPSETLFQPNTRGPESDGDGLGLFLVQLIIDRYDGSIRVTEGESGATFELEIPKQRTLSTNTESVTT